MAFCYNLELLLLSLHCFFFRWEYLSCIATTTHSPMTHRYRRFHTIILVGKWNIRCQLVVSNGNQSEWSKLERKIRKLWRWRVHCRFATRSKPIHCRCQEIEWLDGGTRGLIMDFNLYSPSKLNPFEVVTGFGGVEWISITRNIIIIVSSVDAIAISSS